MESTLTSRQVIEGKLQIADKAVVIKNVDVFFEGSLFTTIPVNDGVFQIEITERFENGNYEVKWNVTINGKESLVIDSFVVSNSKIDPSLPVDLQQLA